MSLKTFFTCLAILLLGMIFIYSCGKEPVSPENPPTIPKTSTLNVNFYGLHSVDTSCLKAEGPRVSRHFRHAAAFVGFWSSMASADLTIPVAVFDKAATQAPTHHNNNTWEWSYAKIFENDTFQAHLTAEVGSDSVAWSMQITGRGYRSFEWFQGSCNLSASRGYWQFYRRRGEMDRRKTVRMKWALNDSTYGKSLHLINNDERHSGFLDSLNYRIDSPICYIEVFDRSESRSAMVQFDTTSGAGMFVYPADSSGCWNAQREYIPCPY